MSSHREHVLEQFSKKADLFASAPAIANHETLQLLIQASGANSEDKVLDVACGAGVVVCAFAAVVREAVGIDLVPAMIERARGLSAEKGLVNVSWLTAKVCPLPFPDGSFSIVTSRYAFHHFENPLQVLKEMKRVCTRRGRVMVADMVASEDPTKAAALNQMEKLRDPSHVRSMSVTELKGLFHNVGLEPCDPLVYRLEFDLDSLLNGSHPLPSDGAKVRELFEESLCDDSMELNVRREGVAIQLSYKIAVLVAEKS